MYDMDFLKELDKLHMRVQYARIILLSFDSEESIGEIQGSITSGSLNVNGSSAIRRTINLTMLASANNSNIENIDNEISINKKIKVFIGYNNPLKSYKEKYGEIVWFPCGVFILSSASVNRSTSGWTISITGKDKMCLLDGTAGGTFPASITFHEKYIQKSEDEIEIQYPTITEIIYEAVNHWGGELTENIIITDIDEEIKQLVKYIGDSPIYFNSDYTGVSDTESEDFPNKVIFGQNVGYEMTSFTYPGELIFNAGDTVTSLLDKIVSTLGNFEYYYDINGRFIFQEIKNYLNTGSPILQLDTKDYVKSYNNAKFLYSLTDLDTTIAIIRNPKYDNVKNDFYVWGERTTFMGSKIAIRYHLAIDEIPDIYLAGTYMWEVKDKETNLIIRYDNNNDSSYSLEGYKVSLVGPPCNEWREELYRRALRAQVINSVYDNYYDSELIAEWRNLYDPNNKDWVNYNYWNPDVTENPAAINYWLDFIDTSSPLGKYSVKSIGRRTKVENNNDIKSVYNRDVEDVVYFKISDYDVEERKNLIEGYNSIGQKYFAATDQFYDKLAISSTGASCFDSIREMLYQNLCYNTTINLTCLPKYYIEPNNIIRIEDKESGIYGNYQITQFSLPLTYNGTMSITATEALTRV